MEGKEQLMRGASQFGPVRFVQLERL